MMYLCYQIQNIVVLLMETVCFLPLIKWGILRRVDVARAEYPEGLLVDGKSLMINIKVKLSHNLI